MGVSYLPEKMTQETSTPKPEDTIKRNRMAIDNLEEKGGYLAILHSKDFEPVINAVMKLRDGIIERFNSPDYVTLMMHVNVNTAKAELIPFPDAANLRKLKANFENLPKQVQKVMSNNIPEAQGGAIKEIYSYMDSDPIAKIDAKPQELKA